MNTLALKAGYKILLYADDMKICREVGSALDVQDLQGGLRLCSIANDIPFSKENVRVRGTGRHPDNGFTQEEKKPEISKKETNPELITTDESLRRNMH